MPTMPDCRGALNVVAPDVDLFETLTLSWLAPHYASDAPTVAPPPPAPSVTADPALLYPFGAPPSTAFFAAPPPGMGVSLSAVARTAASQSTPSTHEEDSSTHEEEHEEDDIPEEIFPTNDDDDDDDDDDDGGIGDCAGPRADPLTVDPLLDPAAQLSASIAYLIEGLQMGPQETSRVMAAASAWCEEQGLSSLSEIGEVMVEHELTDALRLKPGRGRLLYKRLCDQVARQRREVLSNCPEAAATSEQLSVPMGLPVREGIPYAQIDLNADAAHHHTPSPRLHNWRALGSAYESAIGRLEESSPAIITVGHAACVSG
jgi:hypothetical protein